MQGAHRSASLEPVERYCTEACVPRCVSKSSPQFPPPQRATRQQARLCLRSLVHVPPVNHPLGPLTEHSPLTPDWTAVAERHCLPGPCKRTRSHKWAHSHWLRWRWLQYSSKLVAPWHTAVDLLASSLCFQFSVIHACAVRQGRVRHRRGRVLGNDDPAGGGPLRWHGCRRRRAAERPCRRHERHGRTGPCSVAVPACRAVGRPGGRRGIDGRLARECHSEGGARGSVVELVGARGRSHAWPS